MAYEPAAQWSMQSSGTPQPPLLSSGTLTDIAESYREIPSGRLVILGRPGAGKTVTAVRCALDLLTPRQAGAPVPLLVDVKSWNPAASLTDWLRERLEREHPFLARIGPRSHRGTSDSQSSSSQSSGSEVSRHTRIRYCSVPA